MCLLVFFLHTGISTKSFASNDSRPWVTIELLDQDPLSKEILIRKLAEEMIREVYGDSIDNQNKYTQLFREEIFLHVVRKINNSLLLLKIEAGVRPNSPSMHYKFYLKSWLNFVATQVRRIALKVVDYSDTENFLKDIDLIVSLVLLRCNANVYYILHKNYSWQKLGAVKLDPHEEFKYANNLHFLYENSIDLSFRLDLLIKENRTKNMSYRFSRFINTLKKEILILHGFICI